MICPLIFLYSGEHADSILDLLLPISQRLITPPSVIPAVVPPVIPAVVPSVISAVTSVVPTVISAAAAGRAVTAPAIVKVIRHSGLLFLFLQNMQEVDEAFPGTRRNTMFAYIRSNVSLACSSGCISKTKKKPHL